MRPIARVLLENEGYSISYHSARMALSELRTHYRSIERFVTDHDMGCCIVDDPGRGATCVGFVLYRFRNLAGTEPYDIFRELDPRLFPSNGEFVDIYDLWVHPRHRRRGVATRLKRKVEEAAAERSVRLIYTHTEAANTHIIALNEKLGYAEVRRGPIRDEVIRVSLVKRL